MMKIIIIALVLRTALQYSPTDLGQAYSIISLSLSLPHGFFFHQHLRVLSLLQYSYLALRIQSYQGSLNYSVLTFMPSFMPENNNSYLSKVGRVLSPAIILLSLFLLFYGIFRIEKMYRPTLRFDQVWHLLQPFIDWIYLPLVDVSMEYFLQYIILLFEDAKFSATSQFVMVSVVLGLCCCYPFVYFYITFVSTNVDSQIQNQTSKPYLIYYLNTLIMITFANLRIMIRPEFAYGLVGTIILYTFCVFFFCDFSGTLEKFVFSISQSLLCSLCLLTLFTDLSKLYGGFNLITPMFGIEIIFQAYKYYRFILFKKKVRVMIHPEKVVEEQKSIEQMLPNQLNNPQLKQSIEFEDTVTIAPVKNLNPRKQNRFKTVLFKLAR